MFVLAPANEFAYIAALLSANATCSPRGISNTSYGMHENDCVTPMASYESAMEACPETNSSPRPYLSTLSASNPMGFSVVLTLTLAPRELMLLRNSSPAPPIVL